MTSTTKISPLYTAADWIALRPSLDEPFQQEAWRGAVDIAKDRVTNRFLMPVHVLLEHPQSTIAGFGFAMLALDCLPIDALQAFREGRTSGNETRKSYQPILTFLAETKEYIAGELRNGDRPTGKQIAARLQIVFAAEAVHLTLGTG